MYIIRDFRKPWIYADSNYAESGTNAGFVTRISQSGMDLLSDYLKDRISKMSLNTEIPISFSTEIDNDITYELLATNLVSCDSSTLQSRVTITPNKGVSWTGSQLSAKIASLFKVKTENAEFIGKSNISIDRAVINMQFSTGINADGHLKTDMSSCRVRLRQVSINFARNNASLLSNYFAPISRLTKDKIEEVLCAKFFTELIPTISNRLMNTPMSAILFEHYFINYGFIDKINYTEKYIEMKHRGNTFAILRQGKFLLFSSLSRNRVNDFRLPFRSTPMYIPNETFGMVDFYVSNYTVSSLLFWMNQYRKFNYEISKDSSSSESIVGYLRTGCGAEDVCAGTLFPALAAQFPNGLVQIKTRTSKSPTLIFTSGKGIASLDNRVDAFVQQGDKITRFLTARMTVDVAFSKFAFKDYELTMSLKIEKFKIYDVASSIEGIDATSLEFLVSALNELVISDDLAKKLKGGIQLPIMLDFEQKSVDVVVENGYLRISANYCYDNLCDNFAENTDAVDYYDAINS
uniref:BPI2 domain-containing protein n=1 Tax=Syphacia muris TaxID=451379 RepID=A0A0N5AHH1_9BILA